MNGKGITFLAIAVIAIGTFALPSTVSLFSGQHAWYDLAPAYGGQPGWGGNDVPCEKCHADVAEELANSGAHRDLTCAMCHRSPFTDYTYARANYTYAAKWQGTVPGKEAHAASTVECMDCHDGAGDKGTGHWSDPEYADWTTGCAVCHEVDGYHWWKGENISAGGFGITSVPGDSGSAAAHKQFVLDANESSLMEDANEACIACHTHIPVKINWKHAYSLEFNASYDEGVTFPPTHFNVSDWKANGTAPNIESYGNYSGGANVSHWPSGDVTYWG